MNNQFNNCTVNVTVQAKGPEAPQQEPQQEKVLEVLLVVSIRVIGSFLLAVIEITLLTTRAVFTLLVGKYFKNPNIILIENEVPIILDSPKKLIKSGQNEKDTESIYAIGDNQSIQTDVIKTA